MSKYEWLQRKYNRLERDFIRELAKNTNLREENRRLKDGSLAEYLQKSLVTVEKEKVELSIKVTLLEIELKKLKEEEQ